MLLANSRTLFESVNCYRKIHAYKRTFGKVFKLKISVQLKG